MDGLRERLMAALDNVYQDSYQPGHGLPCGDMADAVLAVRDEELATLRQQLRDKEAARQAALEVIMFQDDELERLNRSRDGWQADAKREAGNAADHAAAIARVRAAFGECHCAPGWRGDCVHVALREALDA